MQPGSAKGRLPGDKGALEGELWHNLLCHPDGITDGHPQKSERCENKPGSKGTNDNLSKVETGPEAMPTPELWGMSVYATMFV